MSDTYPALRHTINDLLLDLNEKIRQYDAEGVQKSTQDQLRHQIQEIIGQLWEGSRAMKQNLNNVEALRKLNLPIEEIQNRHGFVDDAKDRLLHAEKIFFRALREREALSKGDFHESNGPNDKQAIHRNDFVAAEIGRQNALLAQHDEDVDVISNSVKRVRNTAEYITVALAEDDAERGHLFSTMENLGSSLRKVNNKATKLLAQTSKTTKLSVIALLICLLVILVTLTFVL